MKKVMAASVEQEEHAAKALLPHLPVQKILARYRGAKGNEIIYDALATRACSSKWGPRELGEDDE